MAFVVAPKDTIRLKINIDEPQDEGTVRKHFLRITYKKLPVDEAKKVMADVRDDLVSDDDILERYVTNIEEAKDENGDDLPFTPELLAALSQMEYVREPLINGFMQVQFGREKLRAKN